MPLPLSYASSFQQRLTSILIETGLFNLLMICNLTEHSHKNEWFTKSAGGFCFLVILDSLSDETFDLIFMYQ